LAPGDPTASASALAYRKSATLAAWIFLHKSSGVAIRLATGFGMAPPSPAATFSGSGSLGLSCAIASDGTISRTRQTAADFDRFESRPLSSPGLSRRPRALEHRASRREVAGTSPAPIRERWRWLNETSNRCSERMGQTPIFLVRGRTTDD